MIDGALAMTVDKGIRQSHPLNPFVVFVFFVVKSPFTGPGEGKGFVTTKSTKTRRMELGFGAWLRRRCRR